MNILHSLFKQKDQINFADLIKSGAIIIDVRSKEEFATEHVKGAINIPLDTLQVNMGKIGDKNQHIITCCASGTRSEAARKVLMTHGYHNIYNGGGWHILQKKLINK